MKINSQIISILSLLFMFFSMFGYSETHNMAISIDPFIPGARGITAKGEFEVTVMDNLSIIVPFRGIWIDSEKFPLLFKSGYAHLDPYHHVDDILEFFDAKDIIKEKELTLGIGIKLYPNSKPLKNGFYIKPIFTVGYAWLDYEHKGVQIQIKHDSSLFPNIWLPINDKDISKIIQSFVFVPEILVGYNITFASHFMFSLEIGAKYRLFHKQEFVEHVPRLTGFEPSLSSMLGYTW